jgi:YHS domain-containing protein
MINLLFALALTASPESKPATNIVCPVLGQKVTTKSKTIAVRGQEYRVCCAGCDAKLAKDPDTYLTKGGTPKNAAKGDMKMPAGHDMSHMN